MLLASWRRFIQRGSVYATLYAAGMLLIAPLTLWRDADMLLFDWFNTERTATLAPEIVLVDVAHDPNTLAFRSRLAALLDTLAAHKHKPAAVLLDAYFASGDAEGSALLGKALDAFQASTSAKVYAALNPINRSGHLDPNFREEHDANLYRAHFAGSGHTVLYSKFATLWYQPYLPVSAAQALPALPTQVAHDFHFRQVAQGKTPVLVSVGAAEAIRARTLQFAGAGASATLSGAQPGHLDGKFIIVGSIGKDKPSVAPWRARSGPELIAWALNDHLRSTPAPQVADEPWRLLLLLATFSALAAYIFLRLFQRFKLPRSRLWLLALAASLVSLLAFAAVVFALLRGERIYAQVTLVAVGVLWAALLGWHYLAKRMWQDLVSPIASANGTAPQRYDIFISYSGAPENVEWVKRNIWEPLTRRDEQLKVFFDKTSLELGTLWFNKLGTAIYESGLFLAVLSEDYFDKSFCRWEIDLAARKRVKHPEFTIAAVKRGAPVVPLPYDDFQIDEGRDIGAFLDQVTQLARAKRTRQPH